MATDALTTAADELYALVPDEFTAARNTRAKEAKADNRELGRRIGEFRKPSPSAWIVNVLVREHPDAVDELLDLGADLRDAQAASDGKALTAIGSERRKLVSGLLKQATGIADAADRSPSRAVLDEVEQTLIAGTVDEAAGEALRTGRLVRSLQAVGFEDVDLDGAVAGEASASRPAKKGASPSSRARAVGTADMGAKGGKGGKPGKGGKAGAKAGKGESDDADAAAEREAAAAKAEERRRAEADVREAKDRAEQAQRALDEAQDLLAAAEWNADELRDERHDLEARLKELRSEIADAERDEREAERVRAKAATAVDRARDDVEAAEGALEQLD
ncbi:hypothetical protein EV187_1626 [Agromyces ramosus]|uniref:Uncharacterized protein n=1 Tax=Agromyces ramosus TaxID=33879 RepID=A0A4V2EZB6_9MICO|nr:hypothetical protein [Agromyces ramosus]RZS65920.1 hypothetical protein EV187_1626 [Agromyces ramosus]